MEQVKTLGSALSLMQSRLLLTLEHVQRQQNAPHLHRSPHACPPVLHPTRSRSHPLLLRPTRSRSHPLLLRPMHNRTRYTPL